MGSQFRETVARRWSGQPPGAMKTDAMGAAIPVFLFLFPACSDAPYVPAEISEDADQLIERLMGRWYFESELETDCPGDDDGFDGREHLFERTEDALVVDGFPNEGDVSYFHPAGESTLETRREDSVLGCILTQTAELEFHVLEEEALEAEYRATVEHDGSAICTQIGEVMDYPPVCWLTSQLQGERRK